HVVQLARDPRPLPVGSRGGALLALCVEPLGALAMCPFASATLTQELACPPRQENNEGAREEEIGEFPSLDHHVDASSSQHQGQSQAGTAPAQEGSGAIEDEDQRKDGSRIALGHPAANRILRRH